MNVNQINADIVKALGLQDQRVTKLVLTFEVGALPSIEVTRLIDDKMAAGLVSVVQSMQLKPAGE